MLSKMDSQFLPGGEGLATEPTRLVLRSTLRLHVTPFDLLPRQVTATRLLDGSLSLNLGFRKLVFADEMLQKIVASVASVPTIFDITRPPFEVTVALVLVSNPVSFSLKHLRVTAPIPCACERLDVLMNMLGPI
jgi:hypothetical protein